MVKEPAVLDSACLIGLERISRLDLLPALLHPLLAPPAVHLEFGDCPPWLNLEKTTDQGMVAALRINVDPGEAEAIALAYEKNLRIILDDRKAREIALRLGLKVTGTVGLLVKAKQAGVIAAIRPLLDALNANSFRIATALRDEALRLAGE